MVTRTVVLVTFRMIWVLGLLSLVAVNRASALPDDEIFAEPTADDALVPSPTADELLPLVPQHARTEADEDQLHSSALVAQARLLERREQWALALQQYQRAFRYAEGSGPIVGEIIPLALRLNRVEEALAYANYIRDPGTLPATDLARLALEFLVRQERDTALRLYHLAEQAPGVPEARGAFLVTRFEMAKLMFLREQYADADKTLQTVREILEREETPNDDDRPAIDALLEQPEVTFSLLGESALRAGHIDVAERMFRRALKATPETPLLEFHLARVEFARKHWQESQRHLNAYLASGQFPAGIEPYELLGELASALQEEASLTKRLQDLLVGQPKNPFVAYYLAERLLKAEDWQEAARILEELVARHPAVDAFRLLLRARVGQHDEGAVRRVFARIVQRGHDLASLRPPLDDLVRDERFSKQILASGLQELQAQRHASPTKTLRESQRFTALALAQWAEILKMTAEADHAYELAAGEGEALDSDIGLTWALTRLTNDNVVGAIEVFQRILQSSLTDEQRALTSFHLAGALALNKQFEPAITAAQRATELLPDAPVLAERVGWVLFMADRWPEARASFEAFLKKYGGEYGDPLLRATVRDAKTTLSSICVESGESESAEEWLEQVLDESPDDVGAWNDLGYLWADRGVHLERALRMTKRATEAQPENKAYRDSYGWALYRVGKYQEAVEQLQLAAEVATPDALILEHLGDAVAKRDSVTAAIPIWRRALEQLDANKTQRRDQLQRKIGAERQ